ncbi:hypothetical protein [Moorena sp. SIO4G3]|nr:hypothetical protein [Moorena sp. SIO4G3]
MCPIFIINLSVNRYISAPDSRFPIPDSRFPTPYSLLPIPYCW